MRANQDVCGAWFNIIHDAQRRYPYFKDWKAEDLKAVEYFLATNRPSMNPDVPCSYVNFKKFFNRHYEGGDGVSPMGHDAGRPDYLK